jgi:TonB family protein
MASAGKLRAWAVGGLLWICLGMAGATFWALPLHSQEELTRKVKTKVAPVYPDLARRMNITGTVRVVVVVAPNGALKETKVMGGHPILVTAAVDALKKWKFEPAAEESTGTVEFKFSPEQ